MICEIYEIEDGGTVTVIEIPLDDELVDASDLHFVGAL